MRNIRTYADIEAARKAGELTSAEEELIGCCQEGRLCKLGDGNRPSTPSDARTVGADLLRYLITGGGDGCLVHDGGTKIKGAYISGLLNLRHARACGATTLDNCVFEKKIYAEYCHFNTLSLEGSTLRDGLNAKGAEIAGGVFIREGFVSHGRIQLKDAIIRGPLSCVGGRFCPKGDIALNLQSTKAAQFFWKDPIEVSGRIDLKGAHFDTLADDPKSWNVNQGLSLIGLTYNLIRIPGDTEVRLVWLSKGDKDNGEFSAQPYTQLAKVLREMGHDQGARQVLLAKEKRLAQAEKQRSRDRIAALKAELARPELRGQSQQVQQNGRVALFGLRIEQCFATLWSGTLRRLVGYGYKPRLILYWTGGIILGMTMLSSLTYSLGGIVPNSPVVLLSDEWAGAVEQFNPAEAWVSTKAGEHYETFSPLAYAADVFIPLVPLGQETAWAPTTATRLGTVLWVLNWLVKLSGWFITALGAAAIAGVIRRE